MRTRHHWHPRRAFRSTVMAGVAAGLVVALLPSPAVAAGTVVDDRPALEDVDRRGVGATPTARQRAAVDRLGATVRWNRFGTPQALIRYGGYLATGLGPDAVTAARRFISQQHVLFRLSAEDVAGLELVSDSETAGGAGHAVMFRQRFGRLPATQDGLITVGVADGNIAYVSSSAAGPGTLSGAARLSGRSAWLKAATNAGLRVAAHDISNARVERGWTIFDAGLSQPGRVRLVALPVDGGARRAYEAIVVHVSGAGRATGYRSFVDAETGRLLLRQNLVAQDADNPRWKYFNAYPDLDYSDTDGRVVGCFIAMTGCDEVLNTSVLNTSATQPWDWSYATSTPTFTTSGNAADAALSPLSPLTPSTPYRPTSATRNYIYPWTNSWYASRCNPAVFANGTQSNDIDAAITNLFAGHNRMHDWSYHLGFTEANFNMQVENFDNGGREGDPEIGDAQAGALTGGSPTYTGRDNANQITPNDGIPPITNMYLWQPIAGAFYPPCVDGDFDMTVIGHEYTHAISNRMVAGPDAGLSSSSDGQARAMGESWSDLTAVEILQEYGYTPVGSENPFAVGAYVTGNFETGIRNYGMNDSPLNFSDVQGYDGSGGGSPHDDGEIWSAVNYDIRRALIAKYGGGDAAVQRQCADGELPADECPGNRRWIQLVFDSYLLLPSTATMLDARDAMLAADQMRFGGANHVELWAAFARRGFGEFASTTGTDDRQPKPSFESPERSNEATVLFRPVNPSGRRVAAKLYVGRYHARVTPIADSEPDTARPNRAEFVPGTYDFMVRSRKRGLTRFSLDLAPRETREVVIELPPNWASVHRGAVAAGDGANHRALINDSEAQNWSALNQRPNVRGTRVTVDLAGGEHLVRLVKVSALLRFPNPDNENDPGTQNRFSALRQFEILTCRASAANDGCNEPGAFDAIYTSPEDAFPSGVPRPLSPDLILRTFDVPDTTATHVRLKVLTNQCTGAPEYQGEQENDPTSPSDCSSGSAQARNVRAAELEVFSNRSRLIP